eukprot:3035827-Rhodomonas_salina.2
MNQLLLLSKFQGASIKCVRKSLKWHGKKRKRGWRCSQIALMSVKFQVKREKERYGKRGLRRRRMKDQLKRAVENPLWEAKGR